MTHPVDTSYFDVLSAGVSGITPINTALGNLSYYIKAIIDGSIAVGGVTGIDVTAGVSLTALDAAYLDPTDEKIYPIDANAAPAAAGMVRGFVQATVSADAPAVLMVSGIVDGFTGLTPYQPVYADTTGDGTYTQTRPAPTLDSGQIAIAQMGIAISTTEVFVMPGFMDNRIRYQKRYSPALDETTTLEHGNNASGFGRIFRAYVTQTLTLTEYGSSNQDSDVYLKGPDGAGGSIDTNGTGTSRTFGDSGGTEVWRAQSFIPTAGILSQIQIAFGANVGSPSGTVTWKITTDNAGDPTGTVLATGTFTPTASSNNTINVSNGPVLSGSTTYWLRLEGAPQSTGVAWTLTSSTTSVYADGTASTSLNSGSTWTPDSWDFDVVITTTAVTSNDKLAQGAQVDSVNSVQSVKLWLKKIGSPTGNLTVKIQTDNSGSPSGTTITNGTSNTVAASSLATSYGYITFTFATPPSLGLSTQYHIVLETADSQSNTNYVAWGADGSSPSYADGEMKRERSAAWSAESKDAVFQLVGSGVDYINPVNVDWWSSTKADMVAQAGDSGGADVATKSTFKCKLAAGFADIVVEVTL